MSLLSESVTIVSEFQTVVSHEYKVADNAIIDGGVNFFFVIGTCTPTDLDINYILLDEKGDALNLQNVLIMEVYMKSSPLLDASPTVTFTLVGLLEDLSNYEPYSSPSITTDAPSINGKFYQNIGYGNQSASGDYFKNYPYPIPAVRPSGSGTINSGSITVTFRCASFS